MENKAISPYDVVEMIPDEVFDSFNELIIKNFNGKRSKVYRHDVVSLIESKLKENTIFKDRFLEIENYYIEKGWDVKYYSPDKYENYIPYYIFSKK